MGVKFLSFLGMGKYETVHYSFDNDKKDFYPVKFIQVSITRHLLKNQILDGDAEIIIFTTKDAYVTNWSPSAREGLAHEMHDLEKAYRRDHPTFPSLKNVEIPEGRSEEELWVIFNTIYNCIDEQDEVYFDITHSFRSIPLLSQIVLNFLRVTKNIHIRKMYYGALNALGTLKEIQDMPFRKRRVPVFDLTPFIDLLSWTTAAYEFVSSGHTGLLNELTRRQVQPMLKDNKGDTFGANALNKLAKSLQIFSSSVQVCNAPKLPVNLDNLKKNIDEAREHVKMIPPLRELLKIIEKVFTGVEIDRTPFEKINFTIEYCLKHGLIQQGYTLLKENIVSFGCARAGIDYNDSRNRQLFTKALSIKEHGRQESDWKYFSGNNWYNKDRQREIIKRILQIDLRPYIHLNGKINNNRNALSHAYFTKYNPKFTAFVQNGLEALNDLKKLMSMG
ncbi:MAG: TIGR02221 family CRISPR-associated protein [Calditrichaeota bacterium]|nr:MAG: TIGR02221 family CRISPR-associated protein [Calditrichota bacterium]